MGATASTPELCAGFCEYSVYKPVAAADAFHEISNTRPFLVVLLEVKGNDCALLSHDSLTANCVELRGTLDAVRDSKNPHGPILPGNVVALVAAVRSGRFGH